MLKQLVNECTITLHISPDGPILIKSGIEGITGPDMAFVRTYRNGQEEVYLPGSSLKGVIRSHAERIARTLRSNAVCDPFETKLGLTQSCSRRFDDLNRRAWENKKQTELNPTIYRHSCPACRLFGSTWYSGRLATTDAYAVDGLPGSEQRDGVGIDRFTGGAARGAKFELEVITSGIFKTTLHLRNFELWQLGWLGFVLQDMKEGLVRIGSGKSRGLGKIRTTIQSVELDYLTRSASQPENGYVALKGVGALAADAANYGMEVDDEVIIQTDIKPVSLGLRLRYTFLEASFLWDQLGSKFVAWIDRPGPGVVRGG